MVDSISGATPWGTPPTQNRDDWLVTLNERREAGTGGLSSSIDDYDFPLNLVEVMSPTIYPEVQ